MKTTKIPFPVIVGMLVLFTVVSIGFYVSRPQSSAAAGNEPAPQPSYSDAPASNSPAQPSLLGLPQTINDITVEITSTRIISTGVEIGICYTTPDGGDWYPTPGHLFYSTYEIYPDEFEFTTETKANGRDFGRRCALVRYRIDDLQTITTPLQFSILDFTAHSLEMYSACQNFQQRVDTNPKAKAHGLKAKCTENSDGSISVAVTGHGKAITNEKAQEVLDGIANSVVVGPWEFTIAVLDE